MGSAAIRLVRSGIRRFGGEFAVEAVGGGGEVKMLQSAYTQE